MDLKVIRGSLFESEAQTLINTVNCVGVMGKGIALEFKKLYPAMYEEYVALCAAKQVKLGRPYLYRSFVLPWVLNFPTKGHWRSVSRVADIVSGLEYLEEHYQEWGIRSLAVPPLGCGNGGLEWRIVGPTLYEYFSRFSIPIELYAPIGAPDEEATRDFVAQRARSTYSTAPSEFGISASEIALVTIIDRIESQPYHWPIGRTTFQKIAYFATELGLPTSLHHRRGSYGPFAPEIKPLITRMVNNGLLIEEQLGRMFSVRTGSTYGAAAKSVRAELDQWEPIIERVADLFMRLHPSQHEIAATVHYAAHAIESQEEASINEDEILQSVKDWKLKRRPPLKEGDIARMIRTLNVLGWIDAQPTLDSSLVEEDEIGV